MAPQQVATLFDELDEDWRRLCPTTAVALARWRRHEPELRSFGDVPAVMAFLADRDQESDDQSRVLLALLRIGRRDPLARRLVLQRFAPALKRIAAWDVPFTQTDWNARVLSAAYDVIASYPVEARPHGVATNIVLDIRKRLLDELDSHRRSQSELLGDLTDATLADARDAPDAFHGVELADLLGWAVLRARISHEDALLIALTRGVGFTLAEVAARAGVPSTRLRQHRSRAERRLRAVLVAA